MASTGFRVSVGGLSHRPMRTPRWSRGVSRLAPQCAYRVDLDENVVVVAPSRGQPVGVVHFLGGAFAGAAPYAAYGTFIDELADAGFTCIATPYAVTFRHDECALALHAAFGAALERLRSDPTLKWAAPAAAPLHGIGHSNGALMHALIGAMCAPPNASNVLVSFNNRQVVEAVPVPLTPLQAALQPLRSSGSTLEGLARAAAGQVIETARVTGALDADALRALGQLTPAVAQLGSVFDEVGGGASDFVPSPEENRRLLAEAYSVPRTLLVQFQDDGIDQTPEVAEVLRRRQRGGVEEVLLPGNHLTPTGPAMAWEVRGAFGPADALAQAALALSQADLRRMAVRVTRWLKEEGKG